MIAGRQYVPRPYPHPALVNTQLSPMGPFSRPEAMMVTSVQHGGFLPALAAAAGVASAVNNVAKAVKPASWLSDKLDNSSIDKSGTLYKIISTPLNWLKSKLGWGIGGENLHKLKEHIARAIGHKYALIHPTTGDFMTFAKHPPMALAGAGQTRMDSTKRKTGGAKRKTGGARPAAKKNGAGRRSAGARKK